MSQNVDIVICGAGSAGIAAAYYLAKQHGLTDLLIVDKHPPLSQTSAKSGENFRNWWPNDLMVRLMNHSIDLMESLARDSDNIFNMERRGYLYASLKPEPDFHELVRHYGQLNVGQIRIHNGRDNQSADPYDPLPCPRFTQTPGGADLLFDRRLIQETFPHFSDKVNSVIHARRAGSVSAQQLGMFMLEKAKDLGVRLLRGAVTAVSQDNRGVQAVEIASGGKHHRYKTRTFINAAGPFAPLIASLLAVELPVYSILQQKIAIQDHLALIPRDAPFTIFMDAQYIDWSDEERELLRSDPDGPRLLKQFPGGLHIKPEGGRDSTWVKLGWAINRLREQPLWEPQGTPEFPELVLRGATKLAPGLARYHNRLPKPVVHYAGYYTRTEENLPLIGPMGVGGAYIVAALSGFGTMASCAAGELVAAWVAGSHLPDYARPLSLARYDDPAILSSITELQADGEL